MARFTDQAFAASLPSRPAFVWLYVGPGPNHPTERSYLRRFTLKANNAVSTVRTYFSDLDGGWKTTFPCDSATYQERIKGLDGVADLAEVL